MQSVFGQPNATALPKDLLDSIVDALRTGPGCGEPGEVSCSDAHSNDVSAVRFSDGRTLMVKRGRYDWAVERFATSRRAAALVKEAGIVAPDPLPLPEMVDGRPLEAYWRVDLPTLEELWPSLDERARRDALRSAGRLMRRLHRIRLPGYGPLMRADDPVPLGESLEADLGGRLRPAVVGEWPAGLPYLDLLLELRPELAARWAGEPAVLIHHDLHLGNLLCEPQGGTVSCVGLLDLETAAGGVAEADLAVMQVLHGPRFERPIAGSWFARVQEGYGSDLDEWALAYFRLYHLVNQGFYSALVGHEWHAAEIAAMAEAEADALAETLAGHRD